MKKALFLGLVIATTIIVASLFVPISTLAKAEQTCPVTMQGNVHFTNASAQPISAIIFHAVRLNAMGEEVGPSPEQAKLMAAFAQNENDRSEQTYMAKKEGFQPGEKGKVSNKMYVYGRPMEGSKFMFYVRAVKFADGSTWKDDGSHSCQWSH